MDNPVRVSAFDLDDMRDQDLQALVHFGRELCERSPACSRLGALLVAIAQRELAGRVDDVCEGKDRPDRAFAVPFGDWSNRDVASALAFVHGQSYRTLNPAFGVLCDNLGTLLMVEAGVRLIAAEEDLSDGE